MTVKIQLRDTGKESLSLSKVNEIIEQLSNTTVKKHTDFRNFFVKNDSAYVFAGDDIATVHGKDIFECSVFRRLRCRVYNLEIQ